MTRDAVIPFSVGVAIALVGLVTGNLLQSEALGWIGFIGGIAVMAELRFRLHDYSRDEPRRRS
jgi:hypothetical protein